MADEPMDFSQAMNEGTTNTTTSGARGVMRNRNVMVVALCTDRQFTSQSTTYKYFVVGPRSLNNIGSFIEDIQVQARGKDFSPSFNYKIVGDKSVDGELWEQFTTLLMAVQTAAGQVIPVAHTNRTDYANNVRFAIGAANGSGSATEIGNLTAYAAIKFWS